MADINDLITVTVVADPYDMALKQKHNPKADERNRLDVIRNRVQLTCGAKRKKGPGFCRSIAGFGTQHPGYGRCKYCGGASTGPKTPEGKAASTSNNVKHGFYSEALRGREREEYNADLNNEGYVTLEHEIRMLRVKIKLYLVKWSEKWEAFFAKKKSERFIKYQCTNPDCKRTQVMGELAGKPTFCNWGTCHNRALEEVDSWYAEHTDEVATRYADAESRVYYSEGETVRAYYHAGTLEDKPLNLALNTLSRLIEKHARLNPNTADDLIASINGELKTASMGKINISWGGDAQARKGGNGE